MPVKLALVEDHDLVRQGIWSLLKTDPDIELIAEARNGEEALAVCREHRPSLVLMDMNMPVMDGAECTALLKEEFPGIKVLILSMHDYEHHLINMLRAGADGYVLKSARKNELLFAIKKVMEGGVYISPEFTLSILDKYKSGMNGFNDSKGPVIPLSEGEIQVLDLIAEGFTNTQMANKLFISVRTIESRRKKLLEKTQTTNTATLIKYSIRNGLIK